MKKVKEGHTTVENLPHPYRRTSENEEKVKTINQVIKENCRILGMEISDIVLFFEIFISRCTP